MSKYRLLFFFLWLGLFFNLGTPTLAESLPSKEDKTQSFLSLADLHFDPFLSCNKSPCLLIQKLQEAQPNQWGALLTHYDTSLPAYGKDSNYPLLKSTLETAKKEAQTTKAQFIIVLGDFLAHHYDKKYSQYTGDKTKAGYEAFVKKTMAFFESEFNSAFPKIDVYFVVGNNDSYGTDYSLEPQGAFFKDLSSIEAPLIKNTDNRRQFQHAFSYGGYYALNAPQQPALRLLFLNSVLFSTKASGSKLQEAATEQLDWLQRELAQAQQKKQKVLIAMHIPTGIDVYTTLFLPFTVVEFWKNAYTQRFLAEIQQASPVVMGVFQGHIHADSFQILTAENQKPIPFTGTPSISPVFGNNPGFKIYSYSLPDLRLVDFSTYYLSLNDKKTWEKEYDFDEVYQLNHSDGELINGMLQLQPTGELANHYKTYYAVNHDSQPISKDNKWLPYYWCAIRSLTSTEYQSCLSASTQ